MTKCNKCGETYGNHRSAMCRIDGRIHEWSTIKDAIKALDKTIEPGAVVCRNKDDITTQPPLQAAEKDAGAKAVREFIHQVKINPELWLDLDKAFREMFEQEIEEK